MDKRRKRKIVGVAVISGVILVSVTVGTIKLSNNKGETAVKTYATTNIANYNSNQNETIDGIRYNFDSTNRTATALHPDNIGGIPSMGSHASLNGVIGYSNSSGVWIDIPQVVTYNNTEYTVTSIGDGIQCFLSNSLASVINSVSNKNLSIILPRTITNINANAFVLSNATSVIENIKIINLSNETRYAHSLAIPNSEKVKLYAVPGSGEESLTIQSNSLYSYIKSGSVGNITITGFNNGVFDNIPEDAKVNIQLPDFIYENGSSTQKGIKFTVNKISSYAFYYNKRLKNIIIPANIKSIETEAFGDCNSVEIVKFLGKDKNISDNAFLKTSPSNVYYTVNGTVETYVSTYMSTVSKNFLDLNYFEIIKSPTKVNYQKGESYNGSGGIYKLTYKGTDEKINACYLAGESSDITYSPSTLDKVGNQPVSATYEGKTVDLTASVSDTSESHATIQTNQNIKIEVGETQEITPLVIGASDTRLDWINEKPSILSVVGSDQSASIKGINPGKSTLTIRLHSNSNVYVKCNVEVVNPSQVEGKTIIMNQKNVILDAGEKIQLSCTTKPINATVTWQINNQNKTDTTIDSNGYLTAGNKQEDGIVTAIINKDDFDKFAADTCIFYVGSKIALYKNIPGENTQTFRIETASRRTGTLQTTEVPAREGYKFKGWALGKDKTKKVTGPGESYSFLKDDIDISSGSAYINLYAIWQNLELDSNTYTMEVGKTAQINAKVLVNEIQNTNEKVTYEIADTDIAMVNENGLITGKKAGTTTVKVKDESGNEVIAKVKVDEPTVTRIAITSPTKKEYFKGETLSLEGGKIKVFYSNDTTQEISLTEISDKISGYNENITGTQTITVTYGGQSNTFNVEVKEPIISVEGIEITNKPTANMDKGNEYELNYVIRPENATDKSVVWTTTNENVAYVDSSTNKLIAAGEGIATITIKTTDGNYTDSFDITVNPNIIHVNSVRLDKSSLNMEIGQTHKLVATINPENASNKNVTYSSSNPEIATVDGDGTVIGISQGTAVITVTTEDGNHTATCNVAVEVPIIDVEGIKITNKPTTNMNIGDEYELDYEIRPENATDKSIEWSSTDENVAYVDSNTNKLIATGEGTATITITSRDGNYTDSFDITVNPEIIHVDSVTLDKSSLEIKVEETYKLEATINPEGASNKNITYSSSNPEVAVVEQDGTVIGISQGTAVITVTTEDGNKTATCNVTVREKIKPVISKVESKIEDDINYIVYISIIDESGVKSVKVAGNDITSQKTEDGRYYFKPGENADYLIEVTNNEGNSASYNYKETGLQTNATVESAEDLEENNIVMITPKTNHKVSKITVEGQEITLKAKDGKYLFKTEKNGTYNIEVTYEDGETEELVYEETRFKDDGDKDDGNKGNGGDKDDGNKGEDGDKGDGNKENNGNSGNNNNNNNNGNSNSGNKVNNNSGNSVKSGTKTDTSTALKTLPKTGSIISEILATITGVVTAVVAWFKMKK